MNDRTRREFVVESAAWAAMLAGATHVHGDEQQEPAGGFASRWHNMPNRPWIGPEYWANPLQDWRIQEGRIECHRAALHRHVHLLSHAVDNRPGTLAMSVTTGRLSGVLGGGGGSVGFRVGIKGELDDYRHALIFGQGLDAGLSGSGILFLGQSDATDAVEINAAVSAVELRLAAQPIGTKYVLMLQAWSPANQELLGQVSREIPGKQLTGGLALVVNQGSPPTRRNKRSKVEGLGTGSFWFADWRAGGTKLVAHADRNFGPILFSQYTLSAGTVKLTAQLPPLGPEDNQTVRLEFHRDGAWQPAGTEPLNPLSRTVTFRVTDWDDTQDVPYRLLYVLRETDGTDSTAGSEHIWSGTIRRDPKAADVLTVADVSCNGHMAFPNAEYVESMRRLDPDMLAFTGDQFYESSGGYGVQRGPLEMAILDILRKWYLHGWTWRELMRDRPSISIPDDHDVYQGNIWGEGGVPRHGTQEMGGYDMPPEWVNVVHRTQTSHHPDPYDANAGKRGISSYFGSLLYGGISFAILADRQFKSGPEGKVPPTGSRGDHVVAPEFDPTSADLPGLELLGKEQMQFLRQWTTDWRGATMKAVISQTIFSAMATTHGPKREILRADYDANGWPQAARNAALREIRKSFAFHIAGDQHLPAVIRYGIDAHGDAGAAFAGPPVNCVYPRWFEPQGAAVVRATDEPPTTGDFIDHFGHPLTVLTVANPQLTFAGSLLEVERDKACGLSLVRFEKSRQSVTVECWPLLVDPTAEKTQFAGWPVTIQPVAERAEAARAWLPLLKIRGVKQPVLSVFDAAGELVYTLRIRGAEFQPFVFEPGDYSVKAIDPETNRSVRIEGLEALASNTATREIAL